MAAPHEQTPEISITFSIIITMFCMAYPQHANHKQIIVNIVIRRICDFEADLNILQSLLPYMHAMTVLCCCDLLCDCMTTRRKVLIYNIRTVNNCGITVLLL